MVPFLASPSFSVAYIQSLAYLTLAVLSVVFHSDAKSGPLGVSVVEIPPIVKCVQFFALNVRLSERWGGLIMFSAAVSVCHYLKSAGFIFPTYNHAVGLIMLSISINFQ